MAHGLCRRCTLPYRVSCKLCCSVVPKNHKKNQSDRVRVRLSLEWIFEVIALKTSSLNDNTRNLPGTLRYNCTLFTSSYELLLSILVFLHCSLLFGRPVSYIPPGSGLGFPVGAWPIGCCVLRLRLAWILDKQPKYLSS